VLRERVLVALARVARQPERGPQRGANRGREANQQRIAGGVGDELVKREIKQASTSSGSAAMLSTISLRHSLRDMVLITPRRRARVFKLACLDPFAYQP